MSRTVIRGGLVITAAEEMRADVLIEDGRIAALAAPDSPTAECDRLGPSGGAGGAAGGRG
ncbi:hypothetical protein ACFVT2_31140 [Streptomyces sp. NPDC058000]|uniref:hypothetical protein n=1 Tax=Streptomyces sp. NPDC058000 TaxID=3346299 RepID=UPI0036E9F2DD